MVKEVMPLTTLQSILNSLSTGLVFVSDKSFAANGFTSFECRMWSGGGQGWIDSKYPYILLHSSGKSVGELVDEAAIHRSLEHWGYCSIWDVSREKVGFPVGGAYASNVRFIAPIYLDANAEFVNDNLRVVLRCWASLSVSDLSASYEATVDYMGKREVKRDKFDFSEASCINEEVGFTLVKEIDLLPQVESVVLWLFHTSRSEPLYTLRVLKPATVTTSPVLGAVKAILSKRRDNQMVYAEEMLRESLGLTGEIKDAARFETAVHTLLCCLGYSCVFTGRAWGTQGVDTLAFSPGYDKVLAISVTITNNIGEKIRTMLPQLENLRKGLEGISISPVIIAPVSPDCVKHSDLEDLESHKIKLVLLPQLEQILNVISTLPMSEGRKRWDLIITSKEESLL